MQSAAKTPKDYIDELSGERKSDITELDKLIRDNAPEFEPFMIAGMLGYGKYHYKYASGREGDWCIIGLASQKNYISLYICAAKDGKYVAKEFKDKLPKANIGKSCVRFKKVDDIDLGVIEQMIQVARSAVPQM